MTKEEKREYDRKWYQKNKAKKEAWRKSYAERQRKEWLEFKKTLVCKVCGEDHPRCLEFHHKNGSEKETALANKSGSWSMKRKMKEIEKCVVLCANCHRKYHAGNLDLGG